MARTAAWASRTSSRTPSASAVLPSRTCSWTTASAAAVFRSSSIAVTNAGGRGWEATSSTSPANSTARRAKFAKRSQFAAASATETSEYSTMDR